MSAAKEVKFLGTEPRLMLPLEGWPDEEKLIQETKKKLPLNNKIEECVQLETKYRRNIKEKRVIICVKCQ